MISVVIPTLNAERGLVRTLSCLIEPAMRGLVRDVVIADGGSTDLTLEIGEDAGCEVVHGGGTRGSLLDAGARAAKGPWLLFLHAETALEPGWDGEAYQFVRQGNERRAATFRFALDDKRWAARRAEFVYRLRNKVLALPYGDQGLLISKSQYERLGGYKPLNVLEDVDLVARLKRQAGRAGITRLTARAITSTARYHAEFSLTRPLRNAARLALFSLGVSPEKLQG
jgi:glycosyltransferase involved in cell wall biosynthesis